MKTLLKALLLAIYVLAGASLFRTLPFDAGPLLRRIALVVLAVHVIELVAAFQHVRRYRGPLYVSVLLTLLFGLLHWKPLADAKARAAAV